MKKKKKKKKKKKPDLMVPFVILVLIIMLLVLITKKTYIWSKKWHSVKMFRFAKQIFVSAMIFFGCNLSSMNSLERVLIRNQKYKVRPEVFNVNIKC